MMLCRCCAGGVSGSPLQVPCRFISPLIALYRVAVVAEGSCGYIITATPIPYLLMNAMFFQKLLKGYFRDPNAEQKKKDGKISSAYGNFEITYYYYYYYYYYWGHFLTASLSTTPPIYTPTRAMGYTRLGADVGVRV